MLASSGIRPKKDLGRMVAKPPKLPKIANTPVLKEDELDEELDLDIRHMAGWTIDFRAKVAYIRLSNGDFALRVDENNCRGIIRMIKIPRHVRVKIQYAWELMEEIPYIEFFGKERFILR